MGRLPHLPLTFFEHPLKTSKLEPRPVTGLLQSRLGSSTRPYRIVCVRHAGTFSRLERCSSLVVDTLRQHPPL